IADHVKKHGDGVKAISFWVDDAQKAWEIATERGAESAFAPEVRSDEHGEIKIAGIKTYGETIHTVVERQNYNGVFMPGYEAKSSERKVEPVGLKYIDHCVGNVELGAMNKWIKFYQDVLGFKLLITFDDKDI